MVRQVVWSDQALADLANIKSHIELQSPGNAREVVDRIAVEGDKLGDYPHAARQVPELHDPDRREKIVFKWRVIFRVEPNQVRILRIVHGARPLHKIPGSFEETEQEAYLTP